MPFEIPRHHYSAALKREALDRMRIEGKSAEQVANELALPLSRLHSWINDEAAVLRSEIRGEFAELPPYLSPLPASHVTR